MHNASQTQDADNLLDRDENSYILNFRASYYASYAADRIYMKNAGMLASHMAS